MTEPLATSEPDPAAGDGPLSATAGAIAYVAEPVDAVIEDGPPAVPYLAPRQVPPLMTLADDEDRPYWVAWNRVRGIGPVRFQRLLEVFGDAASAWVATTSELRAVGLDSKTLGEVLRQRPLIDPFHEMDRLRRSSVAALTLRDAEYPRLLREIAGPPPVLYVRGTLTAADGQAVALVGTRRMTTYGRQMTERITRDLVAHGLTIVSGLARGVDGVAHTTALEAGGRTIAVLGCGVDLVYPPEHAKLAARIIEAGAIVSDYGLGMPPEGGNFPARNRIISGLSLATVVTEAPVDSGALITADFALEQGREVMAVPGNVLSKASAGCHRRIQDGAALVTGAEDIINGLNLHLLPQQLDMRELLPLDPIEAQLVALIADEPRHIDDLCRASGLPTAQVSSALAMLELKGLARNLGGMHYARS